MSGAQRILPLRIGRAPASAIAADAAPAGEPDGAFRLASTAPLDRHRRGAEVMRKVRYVRRFFPELDDLALKVGLTRRAAGLAEIEGDRLWLNPNRLSLHTIAHELVHLLQGRGFVPHGERSCDLYALARDASLVDALPYYLAVPRGLGDKQGWLRTGVAVPIHNLAREAIVRRTDGFRRYIRWFEDEAKKLR